MTAGPADPPTSPPTSRNADGRARAITLVNTLRPRLAYVQRVIYAVTQLVPQAMGIQALGSLHFVRWSVITSLPSDGVPPGRHRLPYPILFWETDYNGLDEPYIESFVYVVGKQIDLGWASAYGFPGTRSVTGLRRYMRQTAVGGAYYYSAYPEATVQMVLSALAVRREHDYLVDAAEKCTPEEFAFIYKGFLARRQKDL